MSRTTRRMPADPPRQNWDNPAHPPLRPWEQSAVCHVDKQGFQRLPDGKTTWAARIRRDGRATGLRRHKIHRQQARKLLQQSLEHAESLLPTGRRRRYNIIREAYLL